MPAPPARFQLRRTQHMLTLPKLVLRNLLYHWRGNLAVLLGVAVGSAVLTGALLVGDSLRGSLRARAERQLAGVECAALLPSPIRAAAADGMPSDTAPALLLSGSVQTISENSNDVRSLGRVTVIGVDERFARKLGLPDAIEWKGEKPQIALSHRVAERLKVKDGDRVRTGVERFSDLPRASSLARRANEEVTGTRTLTVSVV